MASGIAGKKSRVKVGLTEAGTFYNVQGIRQANVTMDGVIIDNSEFGSEWAQKLQGLKSFKISLQGNRRPADTNGQNVLMGLFTGATETVWIQFLPDDGTTPDIGFLCEMMLANVGAGADVGDAVDFNCELESAGPVEVI